MPGILFTKYWGLQVSDSLRISKTMNAGSRRYIDSYVVLKHRRQKLDRKGSPYSHVLDILKYFGPKSLS